MSKVKTQAVILAGGKGSRLRPYTTVLPKPLVPVGGYPIAEIIVRQLKANGLKNIIMATGHMAELIRAYFGNGKRWGVRIGYVEEKKPLGTAGALQLVENPDKHVLVINGDTLIDLRFAGLLSDHRKRKSAITIAVKERIIRTDFGVVAFDRRRQFLHYTEKPEHRSFVSTGVNVLSRDIFKHIKRHEHIGMPELIERMHAKNAAVRCYPVRGLWLDLGRIDDLDKAQDVFRRYKRKFLK